MVKNRLDKLKNSIKKRWCFLASFFWKRDNSIILFGSWVGEKFACNSRYLFQYLAENKKKLGLKNVVWVTKNCEVYQTLNSMGYEVYMFGSRESVYYHKNAGYHIICNSEAINGNGDIEGAYSYGAKCVNLWHGLPLKSFGAISNQAKSHKTEKKYFSSILKLIKFKFFRKYLGWENCYYLSTTRYTTEKFDKCFNVGLERYIESAYPRNCEVVALTDDEKNIIKKLKNFDYIFLYLPTFRTGNNKFSFTEYAYKLKDILKDNNILWIQKAHSVDEQNKLCLGIDENILSLNPNFDINVLLPHISFLVTDYSSVMFDAMYHRKPVLYLIPDIEEYKKGDRGLNLTDPRDVQTGPVFFSIEELKEKIAYYCKNPEKAYRHDYKEIREKYWGNSNKNLFEIWNDIVEKVNKS